jgi:UPF0716 protein FxsA
MITTGAALLIIPGFITSAIGLLLLFPPTRYLVRITVFFLFASRFKVATTTAVWTARGYETYRGRGGSGGAGGQGFDVEGEAVDVTDRPDGMPAQLPPAGPEEQTRPGGQGSGA